MDLTWADVGISSPVGCFGIRADGDHWRCFDDRGDYPGEFMSRDGARNGSWVPAAEARRINEAEHRLITVEDVQACMRKAMDDFAALQAAKRNTLAA